MQLPCLSLPWPPLAVLPYSSFQLCSSIGALLFGRVSIVLCQIILVFAFVFATPFCARASRWLLLPSLQQLMSAALSLHVSQLLQLCWSALRLQLYCSLLPFL